MTYRISFLLLLLTACQVWATNPPSPTCVPVTPDVRTQGFWKRVTERHHPSGEFERIPDYVDCVNATATFAHVACADDIYDELHFRRKSDKGEQAEAQFMAMLLNFCSGRVELCNCVNDPDAGELTLGELIQVIDNLLSNPYRTRRDEVLAQAMADRINNDETLVTCSTPLPQLPPVCADDFYTTNWDTPLVVSAPGLLANDVDPNGDPMETHIYSYPATGTLSLFRDGSFTYVPVPGQAGEVSFVYKAWDGFGFSTCTAYIEVTPGNMAPVCNDDAYTVKAGTRLTVAAPGVLGNDYDPEGQPLISYGTIVIPVVGTLGFSQNGSFWYDAPADYLGTVTFVYKAGDGVYKTSCTVTIEIVP